MIRRAFDKSYAQSELSIEQEYYSIRLNNGQTLIPGESDIEHMKSERKKFAQKINPAAPYMRKVEREWKEQIKGYLQSLEIMQTTDGKTFEWVKD